MATVYDPTEVDVIADGHNIVGFADGTMVTASRNEDKHDIYTGSQGEDTFTINADDSGVVEIVLKHNSPSLDFLHSKYTASEKFDISIFDNNADGTEGAGGVEAMVADMGDFERADDVSDQTVNILVADLQQMYEGNEYD